MVKKTKQSFYLIASSDDSEKIAKKKLAEQTFEKMEIYPNETIFLCKIIKERHED